MGIQIDVKQLIGTHDVLFITLDTLRYDVACDALEGGQTPFFAEILPNGQWEKRHSPASFTFAAHQAFFAGFLPTPAASGPHPRLFAAAFQGSQTTTDRTYVFDAPDIVTALAAVGYHTVCIGGVGFFNKLTPLSRVLPALFAESHWSEDLGVACIESPANQARLACEIVARLPADKRLFMFIDVAACHEPNRHYIPGAPCDTRQTQRAALAHVDAAIASVFEALRKRAPLLSIVCSDHGTAYGEDGYRGHRLGHPVVWTVPYMEAVLAKKGSDA